MKRPAIILLILCGMLLCGCSDPTTSVNTPATQVTTTAVTTTAATTVEKAEPAELVELWEKVEIQNNGWKSADSKEALNLLYADFVEFYTQTMRCEELKITFRIDGYMEVIEPFTEAFASVKDKSIAAWNDSHDPFVFTCVTLRYEDCDPEIIWTLAQRTDVLYVLIESCDPPMVDE